MSSTSTVGSAPFAAIWRPSAPDCWTGRLGAATLAWGVFVERRRWTVRHEELAILPPGSAPLTVLHLSDLHLAPWQRDKIEFVRSLAVYEPDLVINTGDNMGHPDAIPALRRAFAPFASATMTTG